MALFLARTLFVLCEPVSYTHLDAAELVGGFNKALRLLTGRAALGAASAIVVAIGFTHDDRSFHIEIDS